MRVRFVVRGFARPGPRSAGTPSSFASRRAPRVAPTRRSKIRPRSRTHKHRRHAERGSQQDRGSGIAATLPGCRGYSVNTGKPRHAGDEHAETTPISPKNSSGAGLPLRMMFHDRDEDPPAGTRNVGGSLPRRGPGGRSFVNVGGRPRPDRHPSSASGVATVSSGLESPKSRATTNRGSPFHEPAAKNTRIGPDSMFVESASRTATRTRPVSARRFCRAGAPCDTPAW